MYAIFKCGGKQLKVSKGDTVQVERMACEAGETVELGNVMLIADGDKVNVGSPLIEGATVTAKVKEQIRDKKVIVFKKKRRQNYRRKKGHRQYLTVLEIQGIKASGGKPTDFEGKPKATVTPKKVETKKATAKAKEAVKEAPAPKKAAPKKETKPAAKPATKAQDKSKDNKPSEKKTG